MCTPDNFDETAKQGMKLVTSMPDKNSFATQCFEKCIPDGMKPVFEADEQSEQVPGQWCGETVIGEQKVKALLVFNGNLKEQKSQTISKKASKELDEKTAKIKKLSTSPCKCKQDAKKAVDELKKNVTTVRSPVLNTKKSTKMPKREDLLQTRKQRRFW